MQTACLFGCSFSLGLVLASAALAQTEAKAAHGAAAMADQQRELDTFGLSTDGSKLPATVDAQRVRLHRAEGQRARRGAHRARPKLYFETALSADGTVACATCHDVTRSFTDRRPVSEGVGGKLGRRNAPTTMNAALLQIAVLGRPRADARGAGRPADPQPDRDGPADARGGGRRTRRRRRVRRRSSRRPTAATVNYDDIGSARSRRSSAR